MTEIDEAIVKVEVGTEKKSHKYTERDKKITAYHEAGHAVVAYYLENIPPVYEISIIPRGMAGGYTLQRPNEDAAYKNKSEFLDEIVCFMGGRIAEKIISEDVWSGPSSDLSRASDIARSMVTRYGMSEKLGPIVYGKDHDEVFLGMETSKSKNFSDSYAEQIDNEIKRIVTECESRCTELLKEHNDKLVLIAETLIKDEKIDKEKFFELMDENYVPADEEVAEIQEETPVEEVIADEVIVEEKETIIETQETNEE